VLKKLLVRLREDGDNLVMPGVPQDGRDMLVESQPKVFYFTAHYKDYPTVLIRLSKTVRATVEPLAAAALADLGLESGGEGTRVEPTAMTAWRCHGQSRLSIRNAAQSGQ
jgi:hypothetical protein